jgi:hypothetical protein
MRLLTFLMLLPAAAWGQAPDPREIFAPFPMSQPVNQYRAAGGIPGPAYWQNRADTDISARIDAATHVLRATETITYTNNSPDTLDVLWLQLDQNIYRRESRASYMPQYEERHKGEFTEGDQIESVQVEDNGQTSSPRLIVSDTRLQIRLDRPLLGHGRQLRLRIAYHYTIPGTWGGRTAVTPSRNGEIFEVAQWFPRMAVYDDLRGWNTNPYLGSEFYCEYGDIAYAVTVPWNFIVAGSGELMNPEVVLTQTQRSRLAQARGSDTTVMIRSPADVLDPASRPTHDGTQTWYFRMQNTRDVAFTASPAFVWDAARINLPGGAHALAMSVYPVEAVGPDRWNRSTEYVKATIEYFSSQWFAYPWPVMVNLGGHGAGMEYPGIVFDDMTDKGRDLYWITAHEVGHSWFPMIVGSNERLDAWMDEGFNTFIDVGADDAFNHGEFAPKRDPEYAPGGGNPVDEILPYLTDTHAPVILAPADLIAEKYRHPISYFKPALGMVLLRDQILGRERFDDAFRRYIAAWAYKHPSPADFFRLMSSEAGEDLSWWWRAWYASTSSLDLAVTGAAYVHGDPGQGLRVVLENRDRLVLPAVLDVALKNGGHLRVTVPVEAWMKGDQASFDVATTSPVALVTLDPDHRIPDRDRTNNQYRIPE